MYPDPSTIHPQANNDSVFVPPDYTKSTDDTSVHPLGSFATQAHSNSLQTTAQNQQSIKELANAQPIAVVKTLSTRGLEYVFMSIALWFGASGLIWVLLLLVNGQTSSQLLAFPATTLIVCGPLFAWFFIRLKKAELQDPALRFDPSKRRLSQITQVIAFIVSLVNVITFIYLVIASVSGVSIVSVGKAFLNLLVIMAVAGGILAYYWVDEHRPLSR